MQRREPIENFAREIMQLFVLSLITMNPDGSPLLVSGQTVRTYSAKNIMTFSRVFTGLWARLPRGNVEKENWENIIRSDGHVAHVAGSVSDGGSLGVVIVGIYTLLAARPIRLITVLGMFSSVLRTCHRLLRRRVWQCVSHVKVGSVVHRYNVDQFFDPPPAAANDTGIRPLDGDCQRKRNANQDGVVELDMLNQTGMDGHFASSLPKSQAFGGTGGT